MEYYGSLILSSQYEVWSQSIERVEILIFEKIWLLPQSGLYPF